MNIFIILLSFILVLSSMFLILLVLVQLPKKEAGLGQAFGSGTTDALFGPGSGNMLTKLTKWTAAIFFCLVLLIWILQGHNARARGVDPRSKLTASEKAAFDHKDQATAAATASQTNSFAGMMSTNGSNSATIKAGTTNAPAAATPEAPAPK
jgi:preprotein translocase subunit SecG